MRVSIYRISQIVNTVGDAPLTSYTYTHCPCNFLFEFVQEAKSPKTSRKAKKDKKHDKHKKSKNNKSSNSSASETASTSHSCSESESG